MYQKLLISFIFATFSIVNQWIIPTDVKMMHFLADLQACN